MFMPHTSLVGLEFGLIGSFMKFQFDLDVALTPAFGGFKSHNYVCHVYQCIPMLVVLFTDRFKRTPVVRWELPTCQ